MKKLSVTIIGLIVAGLAAGFISGAFEKLSYVFLG
jgi:hypothetical protein